MPRTRATTTAAEPEEQVELDDPEDTMEEEEVEYEEVEEEIEVEEEEEEEVVEEAEEVGKESVAANGDDVGATNGSSESMKVDDDESKKHAELLALPPHGSEVYIGGIPQDASEADLKTFCESAGEVAEVRVMKGKDSSENKNKGFAFVSFRTKELAAKAIEELNNTEFKGKKVRCSASQAKQRLFIGNVPRSWVEDDLKKIVTNVGPGVTKVDLLKDPNNSSRNRGFAFIEYYNHACAEYSRKKMTAAKFKLDTNSPTVSWADPKNDDAASNSQVKSVYVKSLPKDITEEQLKKLFESHGEITKVVLPPLKSGKERRFGFVHFADRSSALKAVKDTEKYEINGEVLECSLAKPPSDKKSDSGSSNKKGGRPSNQPSRMGYGVTPSNYTQPMLYGGGQNPGMAMVPMVLPDGRLAYVMQQPGAPVIMPQQGGGRGNGFGGRRNNDKNQGRRYQPY